jgi:uncharacterized membrane protein
MTLIDACITVLTTRLHLRGQDGRFSIGGTLVAIVVVAIIVVVALVEWIIPND